MGSRRSATSADRLAVDVGVFLADEFETEFDLAFDVAHRTSEGRSRPTKNVLQRSIALEGHPELHGNDGRSVVVRHDFPKDIVVYLGVLVRLLGIGRVDIRDDGTESPV